MKELKVLKTKNRKEVSSDSWCFIYDGTPSFQSLEEIKEELANAGFSIPESWSVKENEDVRNY